MISAKGADMATDKLPEQAVVQENGPAGVAQKRTYRPPLLTMYGHISKLTMSLNGSGTDGGTRSATRMRASCL